MVMYSSASQKPRKLVLWEATGFSQRKWAQKQFDQAGEKKKRGQRIEEKI